MSEMCSKKTEKLYEDRVRYFKIFYYKINEFLLNLEIINFQNIKQIFKEQKCSLLHSFISKYENKFEYYEGFFEILLKESISDNFKLQKINICLIYLYYSTMPENLKKIIKITINNKILENWINFVKKFKKEEHMEFIEILDLMFREKFFILGLIIGIKSIVIDHSGKIKFKKKIVNIENIFEITNDKILNKINENNDLENLMKDLKDYSEKKKEFINDFIINDNNEPLDYDMVSGTLNKKSQKMLSLVDNKVISNLGKTFKLNL